MTDFSTHYRLCNREQLAYACLLDERALSAIDDKVAAASCDAAFWEAFDPISHRCRHGGVVGGAGGRRQPHVAQARRWCAGQRRACTRARTPCPRPPARAAWTFADNCTPPNASAHPYNAVVENQLLCALATYSH